MKPMRNVRAPRTLVIHMKDGRTIIQAGVYDHYVEYAKDRVTGEEKLDTLYMYFQEENVNKPAKDSRREGDSYNCVTIKYEEISHINIQ